MTFRQIACLALPFFVFLLSTGCYDSPFPVSSIEEATIDERLIGSWERVTNGIARSASARISKLNDNEYRIAYRDEQRGDFHLIAHPSHHAEWTFLNVRAHNGSDSEYSLFAYSFPDQAESQPSKLNLYMLRVTLPHFDTASELRDFIATHKNSPDLLFEQAMVFKRR